MGVELELKYRASESQQQRLAREFEGQTRMFHMQTTYFDTADGFLSSRRITLRKRMENGVGICTVKTPMDGASRGEWECRWDGPIEGAIPELCRLGAPGFLLTLPELMPVCGARFTRTAKTLFLPGGVIELALDQGVLLGGERKLPLWEAEAELKEGPPELLLEFGRRLETEFGLIPEPKSKFARANRLAAQGMHHA